MNADFVIFNLINGLAGHWQWLDWLGIFFAGYFEYLLWIMLIVLLLKNIKKYWRMVVEAFLAAVFVRFVLVKIISLMIFRFRPFVNGGVKLLVPYDLGHTSFPSGHASFYFALSTIIYAYNKKLGVLFFASSFLIVVSRVFVGIHWPSDILAGALLGILMGWLLNRMYKAVDK